MIFEKHRLIGSSQWVLRLAVLTNRLFFAALVAGLFVSWIAPALFAALMMHAGAVDERSERVGLQLLMVLGVAMVVATEILLAALAKIIACARAGDPFVAANVRRLRTIGWALLAFQLLDFPAAMIGRSFPSLGSAAPDDTFSPGGWLAVLMVFVLSRVFATGSVMKDELEGTV